jgi:hypothetical protein
MARKSPDISLTKNVIEYILLIVLLITFIDINETQGTP